jgi:sugar/nucleoside kinase (ribokinase family)
MGKRISQVNPKIKLTIKQASKGAMLINQGGERVSSIAAISLESLGMRAINTVGCGDSFIGSFAAFKSMGYEDLESIKWANCAAAFKATRLETRGSPTKAELDNFYRMTSQNINPLPHS